MLPPPPCHIQHGNRAIRITSRGAFTVSNGYPLMVLQNLAKHRDPTRRDPHNARLDKCRAPRARGVCPRPRGREILCGRHTQRACGDGAKGGSLERDRLSAPDMDSGVVHVHPDDWIPTVDRAPSFDDRVGRQRGNPQPRAKPDSCHNDGFKPRPHTAGHPKAQACGMRAILT